MSSTLSRLEHVKQGWAGSGQARYSHLILLERLQDADLILDALYGWGSKGNLGDELAQRLIRNKVGLLELARQLGNVSKACRAYSSHACPSMPHYSVPRSVSTRDSGISCASMLNTRADCRR